MTIQYYSIFRKDLTIEVSKDSEEEEYKFSVYYQYMYWTGESDLGCLSFIEDFGSFIKTESIDVLTFSPLGDVMIVGCEIPYTKKRIYIYLNKPELTEIEKLRVRIRSQTKTIVSLQSEVNAYKEKFDNPKEAESRSILF